MSEKEADVKRFNKEIKDSGGEKSEQFPDINRETVKEMNHSDSKPPEPRIIHQAIEGDVYEPRENKCKICFESMKDIIWVKREDLQELLIGYEDYAYADPKYEKDIEFYKRIKEEYNIE